MFLKRLKLTNYRKFSSEKNIVEFISSKIVLNQDNDDINDNFEENSVQNDCDEIDVASDTTLIIGKNNAGKTTIITALDNLINHNNAFGANDFNYRYLQEYLDCYDVCNPPLGAPYIEFVLTIGLEEDSNDRISNLIPFMLVEDIEDSELDICIRYEVEDFVYFQLEMKELFSEGKDEAGKKVSWQAPMWLCRICHRQECVSSMNFTIIRFASDHGTCQGLLPGLQGGL